MKFTLDWLKEHLDTKASPDEIAEALTTVGLEVESVEDRAAALKPFVVAKVVSAVPHPNSDHLRVCKVDAGTGTLIDVVCGAPNARSGMKSVFAFPGTYIPGKDFTLKDGVVIRGEKSNGMLCSAMELELSNDHEGMRRLMQQTSWAHGGWKDVLARLPGAVGEVQRVAGRAERVVIVTMPDELLQPPEADAYELPPEQGEPKTVRGEYLE